MRQQFLNIYLNIKESVTKELIYSLQDTLQDQTTTFLNLRFTQSIMVRKFTKKIFLTMID